MIARSARIAEILLHSIETCAERYNLKLNTGKCEVIKMFASTDVHFRNGQPLKVVGPQGARYLGAQITPDGRSHREVGIRIGKATAGFKAVSAFWRNTNISTGWKLRIYKMTFLPMLLYGLESAPLTASDLHRLNLFHHRSLRRVLNIKSTYYTKILDPTKYTHTNEEVRNLAQIDTITEILSQRRMTLLGHVLRAPQTDLMHNVCFSKSRSLRSFSDSQRRGRPRSHWIEAALMQAHMRSQGNSDTGQRMYHDMYEAPITVDIESTPLPPPQQAAPHSDAVRLVRPPPQPPSFASLPSLSPSQLSSLFSLASQRDEWYTTVCVRLGAQSRG